MTGRELKEKIDTLGVKQSTLAEKLGVTPQSVNAILTAKDVRTSSLERIASALGVQVSFFYPSNDSVQVTTNVRRQNARNISNGTGNINENNSSVIDKLLDQNAQLIELLKANKGI